MDVIEGPTKVGWVFPGKKNEKRKRSYVLTVKQLRWINSNVIKLISKFPLLTSFLFHIRKVTTSR